MASCWRVRLLVVIFISGEGPIIGKGEIGWTTGSREGSGEIIMLFNESKFSELTCFSSLVLSEVFNNHETVTVPVVASLIKLYWSIV